MIGVFTGVLLFLLVWGSRVVLEKRSLSFFTACHGIFPYFYPQSLDHNRLLSEFMWFFYSIKRWIWWFHWADPIRSVSSLVRARDMTELSVVGSRFFWNPIVTGYYRMDFRDLKRVDYGKDLGNDLRSSFMEIRNSWVMIWGLDQLRATDLLEWFWLAIYDVGMRYSQLIPSFINHFITKHTFGSLFSHTMSQAAIALSAGGAKKSSVVMHNLKIQVPRFDNSELIKGYSKTLIGRCMHPARQDIQSLLHMLPHIWKLETRVAGADLGMGRFQFDFDEEEDIVEVLKMEPFHFDFWMVSLVRWEPIVDMQYPSAITLWIRVMGIPLHYWAEPTFRCIGEALGDFKAVDLDNGRVQVVLNGFKPLVFETCVEFHGGEETVVKLTYEKLFRYCRHCFSLCHDLINCPTRMMAEVPAPIPAPIPALIPEEGGRNVESNNMSYRGALAQGRNANGATLTIDQRRGKGKGIASREDMMRSRRYGDGASHSRAGEKRFGNGSRRKENVPRWEARHENKEIVREDALKPTSGSLVPTSEMAVEDRGLGAKDGDLEEGQIIGSASSKKVRRSLDISVPETATHSGFGSLSNGTSVPLMENILGSESVDLQTALVTDKVTNVALIMDGAATGMTATEGMVLVTGSEEEEYVSLDVLVAENGGIEGPDMNTDDLDDVGEDNVAMEEVTGDEGSEETAAVSAEGETADAILNVSIAGGKLRKPLGRKKVVRPALVMGGGFGKKRMVQGLLSPRKKPGLKVTGRVGETGLTFGTVSGPVKDGTGTSKSEFK